MSRHRTIRKSPKQEKISTSPSLDASTQTTENEPLLGYTPPPPQESRAFSQVTEIPMEPPSVTEENPSFGKSKPTLKTRGRNTERPPAMPSHEQPERPLPQNVLGNKSAECFAYSAQYDDDDEFLRRYAGDKKRIAFMLSFHAEDPTTTAARNRLSMLTK